MTRAFPFIGVGSGPFLYERMPQGLKAIQFCSVNVWAKARTYLLRGRVGVKRQYPSERKKYLRG
jgi:hypothetical protein